MISDNRTPASTGASRNDGARQTGLDQARHFRSEVAAFAEAGLESLTDTLAQWLTTKYVTAAHRAAEEAGGAAIPLMVLRGLTADVVALRKGDHSAARLVIEREWMEIEREKGAARMEKQFEEWLKQPEGKRCKSDTLTQEEQNQRIREIFGLPRNPKPGLSPETIAEIERAAKLL